MKSKMEPQTNELLQAVGKIALAQQQPARQAEQGIEKTGAIGVAGYELKTLDGFLMGLGYLK